MTTVHDFLRYFDAGHLPDPLRTVSEPFGRLARQLVMSLPDSPELRKSLDHLLYAKDAACRAALGPLTDGTGLPVDHTRPVGAAVTEPARPPAGEQIVLPITTPQPG